MKRALVYSLLALICYAICCSNIFAESDVMSFFELTGITVENVSYIKIQNGNSGESANIDEADDITDIITLLNDGIFLENTDDANRGGWLYSVTIYTTGNTESVTYTISSGMLIDNEKYRFDKENSLKTVADTLFYKYRQKAIVVKAGEELKITIDSKTVAFPDAQPFIDDNNRTQVPIRAIGETLGCIVSWDGTTNTATITNSDTVVKVTVGSKFITVNDNPIEMDTEAMNVKDRVYIPVRFIAEALGLTVEWK